METTAEIKAQATEAPDLVTAARHEMEAAFRVFRKRATEANYQALRRAMDRYQIEGYAAEMSQLTGAFKKGGD